MQLSDLVNVSRGVAGTRSRLKKRALLRDCLRAAPADEIELIVNYLGGTLPQGRIGLGPAIVNQLAQEPVAGEASLALADVDRAFDNVAGISGKGAQQRRRDELGGLFSRATLDERDFLGRLILGEIRQGALEGVIIEGIADAAEIDADEIRHAVMLASDPAPVAKAALLEGRGGLARFRLEPMSPLRPMLAQPAEGIDDAMDSLGEAALEYKLDGARVQIHRVGRDVRIFSRRLHDVTDSLPDVVETALAQPAAQFIADGEVIALREDGRPHPFQVTMRRFGRKSDVAELSRSLPLNLFLFDLLHHDGEDLIGLPYRERIANLEQAASAIRVPSIVTASAVEAAGFLAGAFELGHEGVMAKSLQSSYEAGNRGADWLKIKQAHSLDLVILAAEWGSGRRQGWLPNLHLGARDPATNTFVMLGKTFKGLTDRMLEAQTRALLELEIGREGHVVHVRPERVVEIAVNEIQASPQYPAGMALRFARVKRFRDDKNAADADSIDTVRELFAAQSGLEV